MIITLVGTIITRYQYTDERNNNGPTCPHVNVLKYSPADLVSKGSTYFCNGWNLVLRNGPTRQGLVHALEHLVADVHLGHAELVVHTNAHAFSCWEPIRSY